jgi:hypothetical protein
MGMFKKHEVRVSVNKKDPEVPADQDEKSFEQKVKVIFHQLDKIGVKVFAGICVYVLLDTYRQVEIEKIKYDQK